MTKFKCVKSTSSSEYSPKVGDIIEGELVTIKDEDGVQTRVNITEDSDRRTSYGAPYWSAGESVPLEGSVWSWEEIE